MNSCRTGRCRYRDETAARLAAASADRPGLPLPEPRAYPCTACGGWHLTSAAHRPRRPM